MNIPFFTFKHMHPPLREEMTRAFQDFYDTGWYVLGEGTKRFERAYADYNAVKHTISVADGLDALVLALQALDIGPGDEVIVPSNTYIATWLAVTQLGGRIVPVEPDMDTYNIRAEQISEAITENTKCIMPVNLYGQSCELDDIVNLATHHGIYVVEDNAQSQGATYKGKKAGSYGDLNGVSFYPGKNLGALGEAGAVTTDSDELAEKVRVLRNYGSQKKYHNELLGRNGRMDELQAWLLEIKLKHLDKWNEERQKIASLYYHHLADVERLTLPVIAEDAISVFHQFIVRLNKRDALQEYLNEQGIGTLIHYPVPPHLQPAYKHLGWNRGDFPIAEELADSMLSLPIYPGLSESQIIFICDYIKRFQG